MERVLSTVNLGLYGCAFCRSTCDDASLEAHAKAKSMKEIRLLARKEPAAVAAVMQPGIDTMNAQISRLTCYDKHMQIFQPEDVEVVKHFLDELLTFFPNLNLAHSCIQSPNSSQTRYLGPGSD